MQSNKKFVFICGLHRSGTSILHEILKVQKDISGFSNTGVPEDEGQHLQTVFKPAKFYGGPGRFGFNKNAYLNEKSNIITDKNKEKLFNEWNKHWDLSKSVLIEKSPPNLIRTTFLQEMFDNSYFIIIKRNPIAVSLATQKWSQTSMDSLLNHYYITHSLFNKDKVKLKNVIEITYEDLIEKTDQVLLKIGVFLSLTIKPSLVLKEVNKKYLEYWKLWDYQYSTKLYKKYLIMKHENSMNKFNYSLLD